MAKNIPTKEKDTVVLDFNDISSYSNEKNDLFGAIHKQLITKMEERIRENLKMTVERRSDRKNVTGMIDPPRLNYFISGERGSGKTTFLNLLSKKLQKDKIGEKKIGFLHWYDPSESFGLQADCFISVAAAVKTKMEKFFKSEENRTEEKEFMYRSCEQTMAELDKGIVRLSCNKKALSEMSEYNVKTLRSNDPGMNGMIRRNFTSCLKHLCKIWDVDAFILIIDDIDVRTEECYHVLENLRLYMNNDYLIVLMAGDRTINIERLREKQFEEYNYNYHQSDEQGRDARMDMVRTHAAQYFAKLFPARNQYELRSLYTLISKRVPVRIILKNGERKDKLDVWLKELFKIVISSVDSDVEPYVRSFLSLPLRTIIQMLEFLKQEDVAVELRKHHKGEEEYDAEKVRYAVRTVFAKALMDHLTESSFDYAGLDSDDGRSYYAIMLRYCQEIGDLEHGYYLSAVEGIGRTKEKLLIFTLATYFKKYVRNFRGFLTYILFGPAAVALYGKALEQFNSEGEKKNLVLTNQDDLQKSFEEYMHVGTWTSPARWARHANMIWCQDTDGYHVHSGIIRIQDKDTLLKIGEFFQENLRRGKRDKEKVKNAVALLVSMNKSDDRDNSYFISFYSFLAYILQCVEICERYDNIGNEAKSKEQASKELFIMTMEYLPVKSCRRPEWQMGKHQDQGNSHPSVFKLSGTEEWEDGDPEPEKDYTIKKLIGEIVKWYCDMIHDAKDVKDDNTTPRKMGIIWSNFYYSLRSMSHEVTAQPQPSHDSYKEVFQKILSYVKNYLPSESNEKEKISKTSTFFRLAVGEFPLTPALSIDILVNTDEKTKDEEASKGSCTAQTNKTDGN